MGACRSGGRRHRKLHHIGLGPNGLAVHKLQSIHSDLQLLVIYFNQQIVIIDLLALEGSSAARSIG